MDLSLKSKPSCHTLSNAFDISKKTDLTSRVGLHSNTSNILGVIASWVMKESEWQNSDCLGFISLSSNKKWWVLLNIVF